MFDFGESEAAMTRRFQLAVLAFAAGATCCGAAAAESLSFACPAEALFMPADMTLTYTGEAAGTLDIRGGFGDIQLPASLTRQTSEVGGETFQSLGIRAAGRAALAMPDKAAMEACVAGKGGGPGDRDTLAYLINLCRHELPVAGAPLAVNVEVSVVVIDGSVEVVTVDRTYLEDSTVAGGRMTLEVLPGFGCTAQ